MGIGKDVTLTLCDEAYGPVHTAETVRSSALPPPEGPPPDAQPALYCGFLKGTKSRIESVTDGEDTHGYREKRTGVKLK